ELLPPLRLRKQLSQALGHLSPNIPGFHHVSLAPGLSASAETSRTIESTCQHKSYAARVEQRAGWCCGGCSSSCWGCGLLLAFLDPVHGLVVETEIVAELVHHRLSHDVGHLLFVRGVLFDGALVDRHDIR